MLRVRVIDEIGGLDALAPRWNALLQRSGSDGFFLTWEYVSTWWSVYGARFRLLVLAVEEGDELVAVAPLMIDGGSGPTAGLFRTLGFIGQGGDTRPEYLDCIVARGREAAAARAICDLLLGELRGQWDRLTLETVRTDSPNLPHLTQLLAQRGVVLQRIEEVTCYYAALGDRMETFLQGKSRHFRKRIRYTWNGLEREGEIRFLWAGRDLPLDQAFDELVRLNRERWGEQGTSFRSEEYIRFHRELCHRLEPLGWLSLVLMTIGDEVIAAEYDFIYGDKVWANQGGWSPEYQKKAVGWAIISKLFEWSIERGLTEYDFLGGDTEFKERWATGTRSMIVLDGFNVTPRGRVLQLQRGAKELLRERLPPALLERLRALRRWWRPA